MTFDEIYSDIELLPGWMGKADAAVICRFATQTVGTIVEIGSYAGKTTRLLALSSPESHVITIDSWAMGKMDKEFNEATKDLNVTFIKGNSSDVGRTWSEQIDLLFIDGNHSYIQVMNDINLFVPHVKKGGYVLLHDYETPFEDRRLTGEKRFTVKRAIEKRKCYLPSITVDHGTGVAYCTI